MALKSESSREIVDAVQKIEDQADLCHQGLELISLNDWNVGTWASLVQGSIRHLDELRRWGHGSRGHTFALINLGRLLPILCRWCRKHASARTAPSSRFLWTRARGAAATEAINTAVHFNEFWGSFPYWHKNLLSAELLPDINGVALTARADGMERRVSAFSKGIGLDAREEHLPPVPLPPEMDSVLTSSRLHGLSLRYSDTDTLLNRLNELYQERLAAKYRRFEGIELGEYSLKHFRSVFAALVSVAAVHATICFYWSQKKRFPCESAILQFFKRRWIRQLANLSQVAEETTAKVIGDLVWAGENDMIIQPFVPLSDGENPLLGLLPEFPLISNSEENILRVCSRIRPRFHDAASNRKETEMRDQIKSLTSRFNIFGPCKLLGDLPDVDLVVEDISSDSIAICELKWSRHPQSASEKVSRNDELMKGFEQLTRIQEFLVQNPSFLHERKGLSKDLNKYRRVEYLLVSRDHLIWIPPSRNRAIVSFNPFCKGLQMPELSAGLDWLLSYDWLPREGKDFVVGLEDARVNGVTLRFQKVFDAASFPSDFSLRTE